MQHILSILCCANEKEMIFCMKAYINEDYSDLINAIENFIEIYENNKEYRFHEVINTFYLFMEKASFKKDIYVRLSNFTPLNNVKMLGSDDVTLLDFILYCYLFAFTKENSLKECYKWFYDTEKKKRFYFSDKKTLIKENKDIIRSYIENNWQVLKIPYQSNQELAYQSLYHSITVDWRLSDIKSDHYLYLVDYPLLNNLSNNKVLDFFLYDIGMVFFDYLMEVESQNSSIEQYIVPEALVGNGLLGLSKTNVEAIPVFNESRNETLYINEKYQTVYQIIEGAFSNLDAKEFPNLTHRDFVVYVMLFSIICQMDGKNYIRDTLGNLAAIIYENKPDFEIKKHRYIIGMLSTLKKLDQYRMKYSDKFEPINWLHINIENPVLKSGNDALTSFAPAVLPNLQVVTAGRSEQMGYDDFIEYYDKIPLKELEKLEIEIEIPQILLKDLVNIIVSKENQPIFEKLNKTEYFWLFSYILKIRKDNQNSSTIMLTYKELKKAINLTLKKNRVLEIIERGLTEIKSLGGISDYFYKSEISTYYIYF